MTTSATHNTTNSPRFHHKKDIKNTKPPIKTAFPHAEFFSAKNVESKDGN
jgi:hypothetical protein